MSSQQPDDIYPEPTDVGPAAGGDQPATNDDRTQAAALFNTAYAEGHLTAAERDRRLAAVRSAVTFDDLVPLTRDLMGIRSAMATTTPRPVVDQTGASDEPDTIVAIFSGTERSGWWRVRRHLSVLACFGSADLDTTGAVFEDTSITINVASIFGGIDITVPEGTDVQGSVIGVFGGYDRSKLVPPAPDMPVITVRGFALFGGVTVHHRKKRRRG